MHTCRHEIDGHSCNKTLIFNMNQTFDVELYTPVNHLTGKSYRTKLMMYNYIPIITNNVLGDINV